MGRRGGYVHRPEKAQPVTQFRHEFLMLPLNGRIIYRSTRTALGREFLDNRFDLGRSRGRTWATFLVVIRCHGMVEPRRPKPFAEQFRAPSIALVWMNHIGAGRFFVTNRPEAPQHERRSRKTRLRSPHAAGQQNQKKIVKFLCGRPSSGRGVPACGSPFDNDEWGLRLALIESIAVRISPFSASRS